MGSLLHATEAPEITFAETGPVDRDVLLGDLPDLPRDQLAVVVAARYLADYRGHTRDAYRRDLRDYFDWCGQHAIAVLDAYRATITAYVRDLAEPPPTGPETRPPRSPATIARRLATLSGFYRYAVAEGVVSRNPVDHVRRPKTGHDSPTLGLDRDEARRLLAAAAAHGPRAGALIALLVYSGLRIGEALGADVSDLTAVRGHRVLTVTRKGGARRDVALNAVVCEALDAYLDSRDTGPLFNTRTGGRYDPAEAWRMVRRVATEAGLDNAARISPHSLRHTFVTLAREAGVPLEDVQDAAGHADPRTTRRYDRGRHNLDRSPSYALAALLAH